MKTPLFALILCAATLSTVAAEATPASGFTSSFDFDKADLASTGRNLYFVLERGKASKLYAPGIGLILDGKLKLTRHGQVEPPRHK